MSFYRFFFPTKAQGWSALETGLRMALSLSPWLFFLCYLDGSLVIYLSEN